MVLLKKMPCQDPESPGRSPALGGGGKDIPT